MAIAARHRCPFDALGIFAVVKVRHQMRRVIEVQERSFGFSEFRMAVSKTVKRRRVAGLTLSVREFLQVEGSSAMFDVTG